jgi:DNA replication factor GINS
MVLLEELSRQLVMEREIDSLKPLPSNFFDDAYQYLRQLKTTGDNESNYREQMMIRDEERNAHIILNGIIDRRFAKLMEVSVLGANNIPAVDPNALNNSEHEAYEILVKAIKEARTKYDDQAPMC